MEGEREREIEGERLFGGYTTVNSVKYYYLSFGCLVVIQSKNYILRN